MVFWLFPYNLSDMENINNNACFFVFSFDILSLYPQCLKRMLCIEQFRLSPAIILVESMETQVC